MRPKKSLGQNFLTSQSVVDKMIFTANINTQKVVLEIGPGKGILTKSLLEKAGKVVSVEKDDRLIPFLKEKFSVEIESGKLTLVHGDIMDFDFGLYGLEVGNYKIVANIPYYITGEFLRKTLSSDIHPSQIVLLVQKEVAQRIARDKKESILSISVKVYGEPKYIHTVKAGSFNPSPKVDSAILSIENISKNFFNFVKHHVFNKMSVEEREERFFKIVKLGFAHKRKLLINNLRELAEKEILKYAFKQADISELVRAEDLSLSQWKELVLEINSK